MKRINSDIRWLSSGYLSFTVFIIAFIYLFINSPGSDFFIVSQDHGYQLSLGQQVLNGKLPYRDLFFHYGPFVSYTTAFGQWLKPGLISEVLICATGYSLAVTLLYLCAPIKKYPVISLILPVLGLALLSRYYKWYYWFFPLLTLFLYLWYQRSEKKKHLVIFAAGFAAGMSALFRLDLFLVSTVFFLLMLLLNMFFLNSEKTLFHGVGFLSGLAIPILVWLVFLLSIGGYETVASYIDATFSGGSGAVKSWSQPIPHIQKNNWCFFNNGVALIFYIAFAVYIYAVVSGLWNGYIHRKDDAGLYQTCFATALIGIGILPQGIYRADIAHLLQIIPLILLALFYTAALLFRNRHKLKFLRYACIVTGFLTIAVPALGIVLILPKSAQDLEYADKLIGNKFNKLMDIDLTLETSAHELAHIVKFIKDHTSPDDTLLVLPLAPQVYFLTGRKMSGIFNGYAKGILDGDRWREKDLKAIKKNMPKFIVDYADPSKMKFPPNEFSAKSQPELFRFIKDKYGRIVYKTTRYVVLSRSD